jgi:hypothetical protein
MKRFLLIGAALLALTALPVVAQVKPAEKGDLQQVTVNGLTYSVDPYNVFVCFPIASNERWNGTAVEGNETLQCFIRKGSVMTAIDTFLTDTSGVLDGVDLGTPIFSEAQK